MSATAGVKNTVRERRSLLGLATSHPYISIMGVSLAVRLVTALFFTQPGYMDAYYYYMVAANLHDGAGLTENFIWNYLYIPDAVVHPGNLYWMPLTSIVIWLSFSVFGVSFFASQVPFIILSSVLVAMGYYVGNDIFNSRRYAWGIAGFMLLTAVYFPYWVVPDNTCLFAVTSLAALIFAYKALRGSVYSYAATGFFVALSYLTRADALLLLGAIGLAGLIALWQDRRTGQMGRTIGGLFLMVAVLVICISPWLARNLMVTGSPLQPGTSKAIFLREYNDLFTYVQPLNLAYYLNQFNPSPNWGWWPIVFSKLQALGYNLLLVGRPTFFAGAPLLAIGLICRQRGIPGMKPLWKERDYLPFICYGLALYFLLSLIFTFPSTRGSVMHSSGGLLPFIFGAMIAGLDIVVGWAGKIARPKAEQGRRMFYTFALLLAAFALSLGFMVKMQVEWNDHYYNYSAISRWFADNGLSNRVVMIVDPPGFEYASGQRSIAVTADPVETDLAVAKKYGASYLVVEKARPSVLDGLYKEKKHPSLALRAEIKDAQIYEILPR
jgi:Dolichyl-phosphate-mannose-protein mannosyltransferase